jgi:hypothetical protein
MRFCFYFILFLFLEVIVMAYVAPTVRSVGDAVTAADYNIMANDVIDHESRLTALQRVGYEERTTGYTITSVSNIATAADIFASDITFTADGTSAYLFEFYCPTIDMSAANYANVNLVTGAGTGLGSFGTFFVNVSGSAFQAPYYASTWYTPSAGSNSFNVRAVKSGGSANLAAGSGGAIPTSNFPMFFAIYNPVT